MSRIVKYRHNYYESVPIIETKTITDSFSISKTTNSTRIISANVKRKGSVSVNIIAGSHWIHCDVKIFQDDNYIFGLTIQNPDLSSGAFRFIGNPYNGTQTVALNNGSFISQTGRFDYDFDEKKVDIYFNENFITSQSFNLDYSDDLVLKAFWVTGDSGYENLAISYTYEEILGYEKSPKIELNHIKFYDLPAAKPNIALNGTGGTHTYAGLVPSTIQQLVQTGEGLDEYTKILLHFDDDSALFKDECDNTWSVAAGSPSLNSFGKFGKSILFGGDSYISCPISTTLFGANDWTIDWWECCTSNSNTQFPCTFSCTKASNGFGGVLALNYNGQKSAYIDSPTGTRLVNGDSAHFGTIDLNVWTHWAIVRSGNNVYGFKNGQRTILSTSLSGQVGAAYGKLLIGTNSYSPSSYMFQGLIDEFRVSIGIARWTENFIPPTKPYSAPSSYYETVKNPVASDILIHTVDGIKAIAKCKKTPTLTLSKSTVTLYKKGTSENVTYTTDSDGEASISTSVVPTLTECSLSGNTVTISNSLTEQRTSENFTVTVKIAETREYEAISKTFTVNSSRWGALNEHTPAEIQQAAKLGIAPLLWSVGDMTSGISIAQTTLGTYGGVTQYIAAGSYYARILGLNHNSSLEGDNTIHFALATTSNGTDIAFVEGSGTQILYGTTYSTSGTKGELMHKRATTASNVNGWNGSYIKGTILPRILAKIDSSWTNVMKAVTKYTDNAGNKSTAESAVTSTSDKLFIPSDFEVSGATTEYVNSYEASKQTQYEYFKNHKLRYKHNATNTACIWWLRSPAVQNSTNFRCVNASGNTSGGNANYSYGVVPCFVIA